MSTAGQTERLRASMEAEPFARVLRRLREDRGLSLEAVARVAYQHDAELTSLSLLRKLEQGRGHPAPRTMVAVAKALEVEPQVFVEYRLALARDQLDERQIGLKGAARNLEALLQATGQPTNPGILRAVPPVEPGGRQGPGRKRPRGRRGG